MNTTRTGELNTAGTSTRREFLRMGSLGTLGLSVTRMTAPSLGAGERAVILLMMVGGPSQLETFDPKPDAPSEIRGPFGSISTSIAGVRVSEFLPEIAKRMDRLSLLRTLHHDASPIHETGQQLLQTGRLCRFNEEHPHFGSVAAKVLGQSNGTPAFVMLPGPVKKTGVNLSQGQSSGPLGREYGPTFLDRLSPHWDLTGEPRGVREAYGRSAFGMNCLRARRLVEAGSRVVAVNMCPGVFSETSWDCHGYAPFSTLDDYRRVLLPTFDAAFSALIDDLDRLGRLESTLVVATGEFGRGPRLNSNGGRDHWPNVWSALIAGGGSRGGNVIGSTDSQAAEPMTDPVSLPALVATIYRNLGIDPTRPLVVRGNSVVPLSNVSPVEGLI